MKHSVTSIRKSAIILVVVIIFVVAVMLLSAHALGGRASTAANGAGEISAPVQRTMNSIMSWLEDIYGYLYKYDDLVAENSELKKQLAEAREQARLGAEALEENDRLRTLFDFSEKHTDFVYESAKIIEWSPSNWSSSFVISKGSSSGISVGDCVVTEELFLCGQVAELGTNWARVRTVIDTEMAVGVLVGEGGNAAMAKGDFALMNEGFVKLTYLTEGTQLMPGESIITSGKGEYFPPGLVVGTIFEVRAEAGGQTLYGVIRPACDLGKLSQVFVIKEFAVVE